MSRRAWAVAVMLAGVAFAGLPARAPATPFADVPADHWAYQAIQSLSADGLIDGYPDGSFNGDRPLTRYEMAAIVARDRREARGRRRRDRVEDGSRPAAETDRRAQGRARRARRARDGGRGCASPRSTGARAPRKRSPCTARSSPTGRSLRQLHATLPRQRRARRGIDPFVNAYETAPDDNDPLEQQIGPQTILRSDARFDFVYTVDDNVTRVGSGARASMTAGRRRARSRSRSRPTSWSTSRTPARSPNLTLREAQLDNIASSRLGLTYRAPDAASAYAFAERDPALSARLRDRRRRGRAHDVPAHVLASRSNADQHAEFSRRRAGQRFCERLPAPTSCRRRRATCRPAARKRPTRSAAAAVRSPACISARRPSRARSRSSRTRPPAGPAAPPAFSYLDGTNEVVFAPPLPPGARVSIGYVGLGYTNNAIAQRYQLGLRVNTLIAGLPGAEVGLTYHRLWDENLPPGRQSGRASTSASTRSRPAGRVSARSATRCSGWTSSAARVRAGGRRWNAAAALRRSRRQPVHARPAVRSPSPAATAAVVGLKLTFARHRKRRCNMQTVGANYLDGAPLRFFGNAPATWANYQGDFFPQFFGFANTLGDQRSVRCVDQRRSRRAVRRPLRIRR